MRLLDRYLLRELLGPLVYCLGGFLIFWISFDLFTTLSKIQEKHLTIPEAAEYYVIKTPELLVLVLPMSLLLALLYTLTQLAKSHELTAIRAAGLSLWRLSIPFFLVGLVCTGIVFALNELVVPGSLEAGEELFNRHTATQSAGKIWKHNLHFRNAKDGRIWNIGALNLQTFEMKDPQLEWLLPNGTNLHLMAKRAERINNIWTFFDVAQNAYGPHSTTNFEVSPSATNIVSFPEISETPEDIKILSKFNEMNSLDAAKKPQLSIGEIRYLRTHLQLNERDRVLLETSLQYRLATPWTCMVVVLIALPFGAASHRRNVFVGVASSILICFVFFILMRVGLALGTSGRLPSWVAAWLPNLVFGITGLIFTQQIR